MIKEDFLKLSDDKKEELVLPYLCEHLRSEVIFEWNNHDCVFSASNSEYINGTNSCKWDYNHCSCSYSLDELIAKINEAKK